MTGFPQKLNMDRMSAAARTAIAPDSLPPVSSMAAVLRRHGAHNLPASA